VRHTRAWGRGEWEGPAFTLTSLTGYSDAEYAVAADLDVTESDWATQLSEDASESWSQELQIVSPRADSRWSWVTGLYYYHESASQELNGLLPPFAFALQWRSSIDTDAYAVFGQSTYSATERLRLTVGLRYSYEEKSATFRQAINGAVTAAVPEENYRAWTPRIALEYDVVDDVLLYASGSRGFKSGGFNLNNAGEEFGPELVWSYEIGVKSTLRDGRLRLNAAAFHMDYEDLQVSQFVGFAAFVRNAASAKIRGLETEIVALPLEALRIEATIGYLDAEYRDYDTGTPAGNLAGMRLPRAPEWQATGAVEWNIGRIGAGAFAIRADASHQSRVFFSPDNVRFQDDPARTLLNARLRFTSSDGRWMLAAYGQNLTDETYNLGVQRADAFFGSFRILGAPRTYGLEAELRF
jgi:iron complex outermembrane receptor protein